MSRVASAFVIAGVIVALQTPAYPCLNGTILEGDEAVKRVVQVEAALDAGNYSEASRLLSVDYFMNQHVVGRWQDSKMLLAMRVNSQRAARTAVEYFAARSKQDPKSVKYRAWLAEAYAAARKKADALKILVELRERDLMPDAFAWRTLAVLSDGAEVDATLEICKKRAKNRNICVISQANKPVKEKPSNNMRL